MICGGVCVKRHVPCCSAADSCGPGCRAADRCAPGCRDAGRCAPGCHDADRRAPGCRAAYNVHLVVMLLADVRLVCC